MNERRLARYNERRCREDSVFVETAPGIWMLHDARTVRGVRTIRCYWQPKYTGPSIFAIASMAMGAMGHVGRI